jgi:primary-amine oxidase
MNCCPNRLAHAGARGRILVCLAAAGLAALSASDSGKAPAWAESLVPGVDEPPAPAGTQAPAGNTVRQGFPAAKADLKDLTKSESAWEVEWELTHPDNQPMYPPGSVLRIRSAKFMWKDRTGKPQWVVVARMLELAEIYVPYDNGHTAFLDIHDMPFHITPARKEFLGPSCVLPGEILPSSNPAWAGTVHKEVHDDGIRWMSAETNARYEIADRARRGEKMILWSTYYGANYRYLIEYAFGDDGMITCRLGPTGRNIFSRQDSLGDTHLHIGCWRLEPDLGDPTSGAGGPKENDVFLVRRVFDEAAEKFAQVAKPFAKNPQGQAAEGSARWVPEEFTALRVQSRVRKNAHGKPIAFDLIPQRLGALRQLQPEGGSYATDMDFINYDFWVTRTESSFTSYIDVPRYARERRPLGGYPTTLWHCTPTLHFPRGEDFDREDGRNSYGGLAITFWSGFYLKPRDLFDGTPLYEPSPRRWRF